MFELKVKVILDDLERMIREYPSVSQEVRQGKITESLLIMERAIKDKTPEGAGPVHIRETIFHKINIAGERIWGLVSTPAPYGEPLETGSKPHFPPIDPIQYWVEKKLGLAGKEARSVAHLIAWKIFKHGTPGAHMFEKATSENQAMIMDILKQIPAEIVRRVAK